MAIPKFWNILKNVKASLIQLGDTQITESYVTDITDAIVDLQTFQGTVTSPFLYKGAIDVALEFPTLALVQAGWTYTIHTDVTDNNATKTNTGLSFKAGDEIVWSGRSWDVVGSANNLIQAHTYWVDGARTDSYTEDGSLNRPYKTIKAAQDAINTITEGLVASESNYETAKFIVKIMPGEYDEDLDINTSAGQAKYLRYEMPGVVISGDVDITQEELGPTDYYSKVEFVGGDATRVEKGKVARITGDITFHKTSFDSLAYTSFRGIEFAGDIKYGAEALAGHGTWVLYLDKCTHKGTAKSITTNFAVGSHCVLLEAYDSSLSCALNGVIDLYTCHGTAFRDMDITPANGCTVYNCTFTGTTSIVAAKNLNIDANSYKSLIARTPTLTNMTVVAMDGILPGATDLTTSLVVAAGGYKSSDGSAGVTPAGQITVAVGDTLTIKNGIITEYTPFGA